VAFGPGAAAVACLVAVAGQGNQPPADRARSRDDARFSERKRYGKRDPKGRIVEAYGFDLSPVAARHAEFKHLAEEERAERRVMARLRRRKTIARNAIAQILETAREWEFDGEEWQTLARETRDLVRALRDVEQVDEMEAGVTSLERRLRAARERLEMLLRTVETAPKEAEKRPHIYNYNRTVHLEQDTVIAANRCSGEAGTGVTQSPAPTKQKRPENGIVHGIAPEELPRLAPKLGRYVARPNPAWPDIIDAAGDWLRQELGVSKSLWGEACIVMGRDLAAVALAIVSTKDPEHFTSSPGGYFHGMVAKHIAGELHLERTVWALRRAIEPERYARKGRGSDGRDARRDW
jgi:replication initiation protein RepC